MRVEVIGEYGAYQALLGLGLSYGITSDKTVEDLMSDASLYNRMEYIALAQAKKGGSHAKFLESICVWLDIDAPLNWWSQMDTYRIPEGDDESLHPTGMSKQSESKMHSITSRELTQKDFNRPIAQQILNRVNELIKVKAFDDLVNELPIGFLQRRVVCTNYKALKYIISQRHDHRLPEWHTFCEAIKSGVDFPDFLE